MCDYFGENGPKCEKDVKKEKTLLSPWKYTVYFKRSLKKYVKICRGKRKTYQGSALKHFSHVQGQSSSDSYMDF
jgi:hypothetical protein